MALEDELKKALESALEEIKKLQHFKDSTIGLWAMDKDPKETTKEWIDENAFRIKDF